MFIKELDSKENGYNINDGGKENYVYVPTEDARLKMAWNKGKTLSKEHKEKISKSHIGITHSDETKKIISEKNKGKLKGSTFSKEHKENISKSLKKIVCFKFRPVRFTDPYGNIYIENRSVKQFCKEHNLCRRVICYLLSGKGKKHKGWKVEYLK